MSDQQFQQKYLSPFPNERVESFAKILAMQANYIRDPSGDEFDKSMDEVRHSFREMAAEYAEILGLDPFCEYPGDFDAGYELGYQDGYCE